MSSRQASTRPWYSLFADEYLQDGQWHDGATFVRAVEKTITPAVADRKAEQVRVANVVARTGSFAERKIQRSSSMLIDAGKRQIVQGMLSARYRQETWEVEPWPIGVNLYKANTWRIRSRWAGWRSLSSIATELSMGNAQLKELIAQDPPLEVKSNSRGYIHLHERDIPTVRARLHAAWTVRAEEHVRQAKENSAKLVNRPVLSRTSVMRYFGVSAVAIAALQEQHPDLFQRFHRDRDYFVRTENLPVLEKALIEYMAKSHGRRAQAAKAARQAWAQAEQLAKEQAERIASERAEIAAYEHEHAQDTGDGHVDG